MKYNTLTTLARTALFLTFLASAAGSFAQVTLVDSSTVTEEALYFWKADDPKPYHYGASINPHGNCVKVSNGYIFYTWYKGGFADRTLMVSRKKIGSGSWVHVALPGRLSLVAGKGDTHLTSNIGVSSVDGTVHIMYDHHNEDLNYIRSKKNIAFGPDNEFTAGNFLPQQDYLVPGTKITGVTYPDMFNNDAGEMFFERRNGSAVGGNVVMTYYDGQSWSEEITLLQGTGSSVTQGERNFAYGSAVPINGDIYYTYSVRWAESPTTLNEGVYLLNAGDLKEGKATNVAGQSFDLPITDQRPFIIADPRSEPYTAGWAGGPELAISPKNDIYLKISPKNTTHYNYLKTAQEEVFTEQRGQGSLGTFYGNKMYKFSESNGVLRVQSCLAGTYNWQTELSLNVGSRFKKSKLHMQDGYFVAVFAESKQSDKVPIQCFAFKIEKSEYSAQSISFDAIPEKIQGASEFTLNATATSGLAVTYTSSNTNVARIVDGNKVKIMGVGTSNITANQPGNGVYDSAPSVSQSLVVKANTSKSDQTVQFTLAKSTHTWGDGDQELSATASSGLAVTFESSDTAVAEIINGKLHVKRAGTTTINALQLGSTVYNAAPIVSQNFVVPKRPQVLTFEEIPAVVSGDPEFTLKVTSNNPNAVLHYVSPNNQVVVIWNNIVREILGPGTATITVSDSGNEYFEPASASRTITVKPKTHSVPTQIEAEYFVKKSGVDITRWSNSIFYLNSWGVGDYAEYSIDVPEAGTYPVQIRAASPGTGKKLEISKNGELLTTATLTSSPSLTAFRNTDASIKLDKGVQTIRVEGVVGGYNLDWLKITSGDVVVDPDTTGSEVVVEKVPPGDYVVESVDGEQAPNHATNLFDGSVLDDSRWSVQTYPKSVVIDLGEERDIIGTRVWTFEDRAYQYNIEVSDSPDSDFLRVVDRTDNTSSSQPISDDFSSQRGRYVKMTVTGCHNYTNNWVSINELQLIFDTLTTDIPEEVLASEQFPDKGQGITVYPNPTQSSFKIALNGVKEAKVKIYDLTGHLAYANDVNDHAINLPKGIYLVRVSDATGTQYHQKLIVE